MKLYKRNKTYRKLVAEEKRLTRILASRLPREARPFVTLAAKNLQRAIAAMESTVEPSEP